ncbi:MAG: hypothetical protein AAF591_11670 [Verrucomicrobiota bacterium]
MKRRPSLFVTIAATVTVCLVGCGKDTDEESQESSQSGGPPPAIEGPADLEVYIFEDLLPEEAKKKYTIPIEASLAEAKLGRVKNFGSSYNDDWRVNYIIVYTQVEDVAKGVAHLRRKLIELGSPRNTVIQQVRPYPYSYRVHES